MKRILLGLLLAGVCIQSARSAEVFEAALGRESELPGGKEADGIRGDFVLRSDKVEAVISQNAHNRRANMSTFYGPTGVTPGCLYDLTLRGANNDQLVVLAPCGHGAVSHVRAVSAADGSAVVESVTTAPKGEGIYKRNDYRVQDGAQGIFITTTLRNETGKPAKVSTKDGITRFNSTGEADGIRWFDAIDPAHKAAYALAIMKVEGASLPVGGGDIEIAPGNEVVIHRFLAVGGSPAEAVGEALAAMGKTVTKIIGKLQSEAGGAVKTATVLVPVGGKVVPAYPGADGVYTFKALAGPLDFKIQDIGREPALVHVDVVAGQALTAPAVVLPPATAIRFDITDSEGRSIPCKAHFEPLGAGTAPLDLGPKERAHGCVDQFHSEIGRFTVQLPPGSYRVVVVRGPEYDHIQREVKLVAGQQVDFTGILRRVVDTKGWISMDPHNHSTPSGDNVCNTDGRLINLAAEHIEFAPTTEHNRFFDWKPLIDKLGLGPYLQTVPGIELTGSRAHFNSFPFTPDPFRQDGGAPEWNDDPRINAHTLARWQKEEPSRWIQINHPDLTNVFFDRDQNGARDGGFVGIGAAIDGFEVQNGPGADILYGAPFRVSRQPGALAAKVTAVREFVWLQMLNQGFRPIAVGVADAHLVYGNGVGCWRNYVPCPTDEPSQITWDLLAARVKKGNMVLTTGPFLEVTTPDGGIAGDDVRGPGEIDLKVRVQCNTWAGIDRVQVLVNGRPEPTLNFTRAANPEMFAVGVVQFDRSIRVPLQQDAHLIVVAVGEKSDLRTGYGTTSYAKMQPMAYNNPIFVDVDGNGFKANGDTLGFELPVSGLTADQAKQALERAGMGGQ